MFKEKECCICKVTNYTHEIKPHHVFFGNGRRAISEEYGFKEDMCFRCHRALHDEPDQEQAEGLKAIHQALYEEGLMNHGYTEDEARDNFIALIGKNYL